MMLKRKNTLSLPLLGHYNYCNYVKNRQKRTNFGTYIEKIYRIGLYCLFFDYKKYFLILFMILVWRNLIVKNTNYSCLFCQK